MELFSIRIQRTFQLVSTVQDAVCVLIPQFHATLIAAYNRALHRLYVLKAF